MNSKAVKILLEVLGAVVVSVVLSFIPKESLPFVVDLAIIPLIFVALRRGLVWGCIASTLFGVIHMFIHPKWSRILYGSVPRFCNGIRIRRCCRILCT